MQLCIASTLLESSDTANILLIRTVALFYFGVIGAIAAQEARPSPTPSVVYVAHDADAITDYHANGKVVRAMVNRLVLAVTDQSDIAKAWASLVAPNEKVGIKIAAAGGELFTTHRDVVMAIVDGLVAAGHERGSITVWDRSLGGMKGAGYRPGAEGFRIMSIAPRDGYDPKQVFSTPLMGKLIWGDFEFASDRGKVPLLSDTENTSSASHFSRILTTEVTKIINVPVMSGSETNGLAGCLYNVTIPNIDNWRRFTQGPGFGLAAIAEIYANPVIRQKVVLNIMDGLIAQYAAGPEPHPNYALHHDTLYASKDPVAIDALALSKIEQWRKSASLPSIVKHAVHVPAAAQLGLGNGTLDKVQVKNVGR